MSEPEKPYKIETRSISGRGLIKWKPDKLHRRFWITCQIFRLPRQNFLSKKINPDRSEYAQITFLRDNSVLREERMNFEFQTFVWEQDMTGYIANAMQCWFASISEQIAQVQTALGITVEEGDTIYANTIFDQFDSIKFVVRPDAALRVDFWGLKYDLNCYDPETDEGSPPPPPPPNEPPVPPGTPVVVSPPYRYPDDNDDTIPLPDDEQPEPPPTGGACIKYNVTVSITPLVGDAFPQTFVLFGEFEGAGVGGGGTFVYVRCRGGESSLDPIAPECLDELTDCAVFGSTEPTYLDAIITDIVPFE